MAKTVEKYKVFDLELSGTSQGNPFHWHAVRLSCNYIRN